MTADACGCHRRDCRTCEAERQRERRARRKAELHAPLFRGPDPAVVRAEAARTVRVLGRPERISDASVRESMIRSLFGPAPLEAKGVRAKLRERRIAEAFGESA